MSTLIRLADYPGVNEGLTAVVVINAREYHYGKESINLGGPTRQSGTHTRSDPSNDDHRVWMRF